MIGRRTRRSTIALVLAVLLLPALGGAGASSASSGSQSQTFRLGILAAVNQTRAEYGLRPLHLSPQLSRAAVGHSWSMAARGYFSHSSSDGTSFPTRVSHYYRAHGYSVWRVGETLFWATPNATARQLVDAWLASPSHRAIVLSPTFRQIGLGIVHAASAPGAFSGRPVTIVTADYGLRR
ncbi:MAG: CAP domain-containing protein [Gaiellaceae bacterium]